MFIPKKLKHNSLIEFKEYLIKESNEKIVKYNGWQLITESALYTIVHGKVVVNSLDVLKKIDDKIEKLGNRPKIKKKKTKQVVPKIKSKKDILAEMRERGKKVLDKKKKK